MADPIDDGGPAFPVSTRNQEFGCYGHQDNVGTWQYGGMTLRDYAAIRFAAAWVAAISARPHGERDDAVAIEANRLGLLQADAFIEQRRDHG